MNIVLGVRAKNHGLEVPVNHIDLAARQEETFAKLRRCDIGGYRMRDFSSPGRCFLTFSSVNQAMLKRIRQFHAIQLRKISTASSPYDNYTKLRGTSFLYKDYLQLKKSF